MNKEFCLDYISRMNEVLEDFDWSPVESLGNSMLEAWRGNKQVFLCGNGGSAGNAAHLANDFIYGISKTDGIGLKVSALTANTSIITCLANDEGYSEIFSKQLAVLANKGDLLLCLSGSGNSQNVVRAIEKARDIEVQTFAILGFSGGKCLDLADVPIHFPINDMQISEDLQLVVGHMLMQWLSTNSK